MAADGSTPQGIKAQAEQVWRNILAVLESAGMGVENLVKVNHYLTKHENIPGYGEVRTRMLGSGAARLDHGGGVGAGKAGMAGRGRGRRRQIARRLKRAVLGACLAAHANAPFIFHGFGLLRIWQP